MNGFSLLLYKSSIIAASLPVFSIPTFQLQNMDDVSEKQFCTQATIHNSIKLSIFAKCTHRMCLWCSIFNQQQLFDSPLQPLNGRTSIFHFLDSSYKRAQTFFSSFQSSGHTNNTEIEWIPMQCSWIKKLQK